jgi:N-acetyl-alpha-D-muramate 1-phosphate uridylyltransferase
MKAMILAAGRGERMRPLTDETPKPLLELCGRPIIEWTIERLARAGFKELVINHAHLGHMIETALGDGGRLGVSIRYSPEAAALETAGGIANALPLLGDYPFLVVNGDIFFDFDFASLRSRALGSALAHLVLVPNPAQHPQGDFALREGNVREDGTPRWTYSGVGLYRPEFFQPVRPGDKARLAPLLRPAMGRGLVTGEIGSGEWHDIGTPERLASLNLSLATRRA